MRKLDQTCRMRGYRELGPVVIADDGGVWDTRNITTDEEWIAF